MAAAPYFRCPPRNSAGAHDSDAAGFGSGAPDAGHATAVMVSQELSVSARPRMRRSSGSSSGTGKHQQQQTGAGGAKKPPQRGLGVAELERLRCGGDPLLQLGVVGNDPGAQQAVHHHLLRCNHDHVPASVFDAANARYCSSSLLVQPPPQPAVPAGCCYVHHPLVAGVPRAPTLAPGQQYFMDRSSGRMGGFSPASNGFNASGDHQAQLPQHEPAPEHPSSQSTIWRPAASSSLHSGHRCDVCARRTMRPFAERRGSTSSPPPAPPSLTATTTMPDYSIYDLAAAMATARQGESPFLVPDRKREEAQLTADAPAKKEVREIEFFPAASTHHHSCSGGGSGLDESEFVAPTSSSYGAGGSYTAAPAALDLSLRL